MLGWLMILGILILITMICVLLKIRNGRWSDWDMGVITFGVCAIIIGLVVLIGPLFARQEINTFKRYQELVEASYSKEETELNYAMNIQVIELNTWLAEARASEETFGIFSFYRGQLDDLEYIEIGDE